MMQPLANQYAVSRPVYSEDAFVNQYQKIARHHKSQLDHVKEYLTCDSKRAKNAALSLFPFIGWMRIYRIKEWLLSDMLSGVSTGLVAVLQGLAFSLLAELPASYGLFTAFFPVLVYFFLGTSRHISVGSFPVLSLMVGTVVTRIVPGESPEANITTTTITIPGFEGLTLEQQRVVVAASVTFLMGVFQLAMGVLQVGFIVMYLSDTLISGFTTAAAIHILVSQLKFVLALPVKCPNGPLAIICNLEQIFSQITDTNIADLVISIIIILVVFVVKELNDKFKAKLPVPIPIEVIVTIVVCGLSYGFNFEEKFGVEVLGQMQSGYEAPMAPNSEVLQMSAVEAFPMAIVGFAVAFSVAKVYSIKHDYIIDGNQELIAFGVSNIFGASFRSFAASTALSRSAVQESTGGKTQVAGLISAMMAMIVTMWIGFLLEPLPKSVLGALVVVNLKGMLMQFREIPYLWRKDRPDCKAKTPDHWSWSEMLHLFTRLSESNFGETRVLAMMVTSMVAPVVCPILTFAQVVWIATCILAVLLGLDLGLAAGVGVELLTVVIRTQFNRCCVLANIKGTDIYKDRKDYLNVYEPEGVKIFRIPAPIFFANIEFFKGKLIESVGFNPLRILRKRNKALRKIKKLLKNGELQITEKGLLHTGSAPIEESEDESNMEELDQPIDFKNLPIQVNWNAELPANICVPKVDIHSVILDFAAVSFLDISALKGLKTILKEFIRVDVAVYIVACDVYILEKLHSCKFFDDEIKTSIFFLTLHDAVLYILEKHPEQSEGRLISDKDFFQNHLYRNSVPCLRSRDKGDAESRL